MRTQIWNKLSALLCLGLLCGAGYSARAQIQVGTNGSTLNAFTNLPAASSWSSKTVPGTGADPETDAGLDAYVNGGTNAINSITNILTTDGANPPALLANATWSSSGLYIQTRPTGNAATLLLATLTNVSGSKIASFRFKYDYTQKANDANAVANEAIKGHRIYYSATGNGTWTALGDFGNSFTTNVVQPINVLVDVSGSPWNAGAAFYLLFADDNSGPNADGANSIDNFAITNIVTAPTPPSILAQPQGSTNSPGSTIVLTVSAVGSAPLYYLWRKDSNALGSFTTTSSYTINNAQQSDSGFYSVIVSNSLGTITSTNVFVSIQCTLPAGFVSQPSSQTLATGGTISLSTTASGTFPITYQWYRNGAALPGATGSTYTKANAVTGDSGLYAVVINNCFDSPVTSANALISISDTGYVLMGLTNYFWKYEQSNTDQPGFQNPGFNDSGWLSGRGIFGFETDAATILPLTNTVLNHFSPDYITRYFRTTFVLTNDPSFVTLVSSNYFDDGAVVYLNGTEAFRYNMGVGTITRASLAAANLAENIFTVSNLPSSLLVLGTNTVAVELHQVNNTSSDTDFGMAIFVNFLAPGQLIITNQPASLAVEETHAAVLNLGLQGLPAFFQWYKNGVAVSNATANPLVIPAASTNDAGNYTIVASNSFNTVTSAVAVLTVFTDINGPVLIAADGTAGPTSVLVSWSELVSPATATNLANYKITNTVDGATLTINSAVLQNGTNVLLQTAARTTGYNYILVVNNVRDTSPRANLVTPNSAIPISSSFSFVSLTSGWDFYDPYPDNPVFDPADLGTAWRNRNYVEGTTTNNGFTDFWSPGQSVFWLSQNSGDVPGPLGTQLSETSAYISYYRLWFNAQVSQSGLTLNLTHIFDDGAVVYLNGTEIYRFNMPSGTINYLTPASTLATPVTRIGPISLPTSALVSGSNLLAVELHQIEAIGTNKIMGLQLDGKSLSVVTGAVVITSGPLDVTVTEGQPATFSVVQAGGASFQWQLTSNSVTGNILGATAATFTVTNVTAAMNNNKYRVVVTGLSGSATSTNGTLHVLSDTNAPALVSAYGATNVISVNFSENVTSATANAPGNYSVTNSAGQAFAVTSATLINGTNVNLTFASLNAATYYVVVNNIRDTSLAANLIAPNSTVKVGGFPIQMVNMTNGVWKYEQSNTDLGTVWSGLSYNDSAWSSGPALLGGKAGAAVPPLPVPLGTTLTVRDSGGVNDIITHYFRIHFTSPFAAASGTLTFRMVMDDGCVIYLNGVEAFRQNLPAGPIGFATLAPVAAPSDGNDSPFISGPFTVAVGNVVAGDNVIAVEVHQNSLTSSDVYWAGEFSLSMDSGVVQPGGVQTGNPVQIVTQPRSRTNAVNSAASLYVVATGDPSLKYQWRTNNVNIPGQTNSTIILNPIQVSNAGNYTVTVSNSFSGAISALATVTVTNGGCTPALPASPPLKIDRSGSSFLISWNSAAVPTNSCLQTGVFTLQRAFYLSNAPSTIVWSNVTTVSPFSEPFNKYTNRASFLRLKL